MNYQMNIVTKYGFRKCSDIDLDYPFFEVLDDSGVTLMDISKSLEGEIQVLFYEGCSTKKVSMDLLKSILEEGQKLLQGEDVSE